jgi:hypothetical protein
LNSRPSDVFPFPGLQSPVPYPYNFVFDRDFAREFVICFPTNTVFYPIITKTLGVDPAYGFNSVMASLIILTASVKSAQDSIKPELWTFHNIVIIKLHGRTLCFPFNNIGLGAIKESYSVRSLEA